jgi:hypothetical protein
MLIRTVKHIIVHCSKLHGMETINYLEPELELDCRLLWWENPSKNYTKIARIRRQSSFKLPYIHISIQTYTFLLCAVDMYIHTYIHTCIHSILYLLYFPHSKLNSGRLLFSSGQFHLLHTLQPVLQTYTFNYNTTILLWTIEHNRDTLTLTIICRRETGTHRKVDTPESLKSFLLSFPQQDPETQQKQLFHVQSATLTTHLP